MLYKHIDSSKMMLEFPIYYYICILDIYLYNIKETT